MIAEGTEGLFRRVLLASTPFGLAGGTDAMNWAMARVAQKIDPAASVDEILAAQEEVHKAALVGRSEEHTSELQSRFDLVCRLLLEKKNTTEAHAESEA